MREILVRTALLSPTVLLELPVPIVQWAYLSCLEPSRDAVKVKGVLAIHVSKATQTPGGGTHVANPPCYSALLVRR